MPNQEDRCRPRGATWHARTGGCTIPHPGTSSGRPKENPLIMLIDKALGFAHFWQLCIQCHVNNTMLNAPMISCQKCAKQRALLIDLCLVHIQGWRIGTTCGNLSIVVQLMLAYVGLWQQQENWLACPNPPVLYISLKQTWKFWSL